MCMCLYSCILTCCLFACVLCMCMRVRECAACVYVCLCVCVRVCVHECASCVYVCLCVCVCMCWCVFVLYFLCGMCTRMFTLRWFYLFICFVLLARAGKNSKHSAIAPSSCRLRKPPLVTCHSTITYVEWFFGEFFWRVFFLTKCHLISGAAAIPLLCLSYMRKTLPILSVGCFLFYFEGGKATIKHIHANTSTHPHAYRYIIFFYLLFEKEKISINFSDL